MKEDIVARDSNKIQQQIFGVFYCYPYVTLYLRYVALRPYVTLHFRK